MLREETMRSIGRFVCADLARAPCMAVAVALALLVTGCGAPKAFRANIEHLPALSGEPEQCQEVQQPYYGWGSGPKEVLVASGPQLGQGYVPPAVDRHFTGEWPRHRLFKGRRLSIDIAKADVHNVFRLLADVSRLNLVIDESVKGSVTLRLVNVPWDQALLLICQLRDLVAERQGNIILVTTYQKHAKLAEH